MTILMQTLDPGYNCRGNLWIGPARIDAIYDTGSTRNSIDKQILEALVRKQATVATVRDIAAVDPLTTSTRPSRKPMVLKRPS